MPEYVEPMPSSLFKEPIESYEQIGFSIKDMEGFQPDFLAIHSTKRNHKAKGKTDNIDYARLPLFAHSFFPIKITCPLLL